MVLERTKRRRRLLSWLPAAVLAVVIVAVAAFTASLGANKVGTAPTAVPTDARSDLGASIYTEAGQSYIEATREIIVDARALPVNAEPLGLEPQQTFTLDPTEDVYASLVVHGPSGVLSFLGTSATVSSSGGVLTAVTSVDDSVALSFSQTRASFIERAADWGVAPDGVEGFTEAAAAASDGPFTWTMHAPDAEGLALEMTVSCSASSRCVLDYRVLLD